MILADSQAYPLLHNHKKLFVLYFLILTFVAVPIALFVFLCCKRVFRHRYFLTYIGFEDICSIFRQKPDL